MFYWGLGLGFVLGVVACLGGIQAFAWWVDRGFDLASKAKPDTKPR